MVILPIHWQTNLHHCAWNWPQPTKNAPVVSSKFQAKGLTSTWELWKQIKIWQHLSDFITFFSLFPTSTRIYLQIWSLDIFIEKLNFLLIISPHPAEIQHTFFLKKYSRKMINTRKMWGISKKVRIVCSFSIITTAGGWP